VSARVGDVKNNDPSLIEPIAAAQPDKPGAERGATLSRCAKNEPCCSRN
jgi:hypothetical protein